MAVPHGATIASLAMGDPETARRIQQANLVRPGWADTRRVDFGGSIGWLLGLFGVRRTRRDPRYGIDASLPAGQTLWVPAELDPEAPVPSGFRRVPLPRGNWPLAKLAGGYPDFEAAIARANPALSAQRISQGGLYVDLPDSLPLMEGVPAAPAVADRPSGPELTKLARHLVHRGDPHALDSAHGLLGVRPGDTPSSLAALVFGDPSKWAELAPGARPDTDLARQGWTAVAIPRAYVAPNWGDVYPLAPVDPFLRQLAPAAAKIEEQTGIPAAVTLAQAAVESAMGTSKIGDYNIFGIKGVGSRGSIASRTTEYVDGRPFTTVAYFADYGSWTEAMEAHAQVLEQPEYAAAMAHPHDPIAFARALNGVYATDPTYADTLIRVMKEQNLLGP